MGWSSGWNSRGELARHLVEPQSWTNDNGVNCQTKTLKQCFRGNNLWVIHELYKDGVSTSKFIVLYMLKRFGHEGWGYKDVGEECGPTYYNCPLSWFDEVPDPGSYATEWRATCRKYYEKLAAVRQNLKTAIKITFNSEIRFSDGVSSMVFTIERLPRGTCVRRDDGTPVRLSKRLLASGTFE